MRLRGRSLPLLSGLMIRVDVSCSVGCRRDSDPALLWLWHRMAATAPITPLAWEPPCAAGAAQEMAKRQKKKKKEKKHIAQHLTLGTQYVHFFLSLAKRGIKTNRTLNLYMKRKDRNIQHSWTIHSMKDFPARMKADIWCYYSKEK